MVTLTNLQDSSLGSKCNQLPSLVQILRRHQLPLHVYMDRKTIQNICSLQSICKDYSSNNFLLVHLVLDLMYFFSEAIQQSAQIFTLKEGKVFAQPEAESKVSRRSFTVNVRVKPLIKAELLQEVNLQESGPGIRSVRASFPQWDLRVWQSVLSAHCRGIRCVYEPV